MQLAGVKRQCSGCLKWRYGRPRKNYVCRSCREGGLEARSTMHQSRHESAEVGACDRCGVEWRSGSVVDNEWLCWRCGG